MAFSVSSCDFPLTDRREETSFDGETFFRFFAEEEAGRVCFAFGLLCEETFGFAFGAGFLFGGETFFFRFAEGGADRALAGVFGAGLATRFVDRLIGFFFREAFALRPDEVLFFAGAFFDVRVRFGAFLAAFFAAFFADFFGTRDATG